MSLLTSQRGPVIITNAQSLAGFAPRSQWTANHLKEAGWGDEVVKVSVSPSGRFDGAESGPLWGLSQDEEVLVRPPETHMRLHDLLTLLSQPTSESFYLEYNALHQYLGETFASSMAPRPPISSSLRPLLTNLWLGKGSTTSPLHYDEYENLLAQINGVKQLLLFPPEDYPNLQYTARPKGRLSYEWPNTFTRTPIDAKGRAHKVVFAASINWTHPDPRQALALEGCSPMVCELQPGETLLLPAYWHHEVHSHAAQRGQDEEEGEQPLNVAVNFWFRNVTSPPECFL